MEVYYTVFVGIKPRVEEDWVNWMTIFHIPDVMNSGCFTNYTFLKVVDASFDQFENYSWYEIRYTASDIERFNTYLNEYADPLRAEHELRYEGKFTAFRSITAISTTDEE